MKVVARIRRKSAFAKGECFVDGLTPVAVAAGIAVQRAIEQIEAKIVGSSFESDDELNLIVSIER